MKLSTLFVVGVCASTFLVSCGSNHADKTQLSITHTTLVDGDAYAFFQLVGAKAVYENDYAAYVAGVANSSEAKQLAAKVQEVYSEMIPGLDSLAITKQVDFPIKGAEKFVAPDAKAPIARDEAPADSATNAEAVSIPATTTTFAYSDAAYIQHVQTEAALVKEQLQRMTRSTDADVQAFAEKNLDKVKSLFALAGGKEDANTQH